MIALATAVALVGTAACAPSPLEASWRTLLATHPGVAASKERETAREEAARGAAAGWWPRVDATAGWQYSTDVPELRMAIPSPVPGAAPLSIDRTLGDHDRVETGLQATWTLFSGFSTVHARSREKEALEAARADAAQLRTSLALQMAQIDIAIRAGLVERRLRRETCSAREAWYAGWKAREASGTATRSQVLQARAELLRVRADTVSASRRIDSLLSEFRALAGSGWPGRLEDTVQDGICPESTPQSPGPTWQERSVEKQAGSIREARAAATATRWPWVVATAAVKSGDPGANQFATGWNTWGVAGIQAQWTLFDGMERDAAGRRLGAEARALDLEGARMRVARLAQWEVLRDELSRTGSEREAVEAALDASTEASAATAAALASGAAIPDDLLDARLRESEMRARLALLRLREASIATRLRFLSGEPFSFEGTP